MAGPLFPILDALSDGRIIRRAVTVALYYGDVRVTQDAGNTPDIRTVFEQLAQAHKAWKDKYPDVR